MQISDHSMFYCGNTTFYESEIGAVEILCPDLYLLLFYFFIRTLCLPNQSQP